MRGVSENTSVERKLLFFREFVTGTHLMCAHTAKVFRIRQKNSDGLCHSGQYSEFWHCFGCDNEMHVFNSDVKSKSVEGSASTWQRHFKLLEVRNKVCSAVMGRQSPTSDTDSAVEIIGRHCSHKPSNELSIVTAKLLLARCWW